MFRGTVSIMWTIPSFRLTMKNKPQNADNPIEHCYGPE